VEVLDTARCRLEAAQLYPRHHGLGEYYARAYMAAAAVTLDRHHESRASLTVRVDPGSTSHVEVDWDEPSADDRRAHGNTDDATEFAAYGLGLIVTDVNLSLVALRRAQRKSGGDYWLVPAGSEVRPDDAQDFDRTDMVLLEVSGIDEDTEVGMRSRLSQKTKQVRRFEKNLRALAVVVGFRGARIWIKDA
jgi:hypothetical protein